MCRKFCIDLFGILLLAASFCSVPAAAQTKAFVEIIQKGSGEAEAGKFATAAETFKECERLFPAAFECNFFRGKILRVIPGRTDEAIKEFLAALSKTDSRADLSSVYYDLGQIYRASGKKSEALVAFSKALQNSPENAKAYIGRAMAYYENGEPAKGIPDASFLVRRNPNDAKAFDLRGTLYAAIFDHQNAILDLSRAIRLDPSFAMPLVTRGNIYALQEKFELAIADHTKAVSIDPQLAIAYVSRAAAYCSSKKKELANADERKAIELGGKIAQPCRF